jgi:hypothetical protein
MITILSNFYTFCAKMAFFWKNNSNYQLLSHKHHFYSNYENFLANLFEKNHNVDLRPTTTKARKAWWRRPTTRTRGAAFGTATARSSTTRKSASKCIARFCPFSLEGPSAHCPLKANVSFATTNVSFSESYRIRRHAIATSSDTSRMPRVTCFSI